MMLRITYALRLCVYLTAGFLQGRFHLVNKLRSWWRTPGDSSSAEGSELWPSASEETQETPTHS